MSGPLKSGDSLGKAVAGTILGFIFALGTASLLMMALGVTVNFYTIQGQFTMWSIGPVWCAVICVCFFFRTPLRAWVWLGLANSVIWTPVFLWSRP